MSQCSTPEPQPPTPTPNPVVLWFCQISSALQGRWPSGRAQAQGVENSAGGTERLMEEAKAATAAGNRVGPRRKTATCQGVAMTEATVCLLLDRFAPS
ncbi:uncharacterized protein LOC133911167 [Phragmites australis]|uniref:uncharacterized protein LOC133911167 n=1 Tax=Phragmites australis TaxID=29695 RepID=UPI002D7889E7|nr:uncharacterized protein LOC133911167 [Phragmites australis]